MNKLELVDFFGLNGPTEEELAIEAKEIEKEYAVREAKRQEFIDQWWAERVERADRLGIKLDESEKERRFEAWEQDLMSW